MKKAAFTLLLEFDHDYTQEEINEVKEKLLHILKAEAETGNMPVTMFSIRRERHRTVSPTWTPEATPIQDYSKGVSPLIKEKDHLNFPPKDTQFGILGQPPKKTK